MSDLKVNVSESDGAVVASIVGDASVGNVSQLQIPLMKLQARRPKLLILDLSALAFIASLGMGVLVSLDRDVRRHGGVVRMAGAQPAVLLAFQRARLNDVFEIHSDVASALAG